MATGKAGSERHKGVALVKNLQQAKSWKKRGKTLEPDYMTDSQKKAAPERPVLQQGSQPQNLKKTILSTRFWIRNS